MFLYLFLLRRKLAISYIMSFSVSMGMDQVDNIPQPSALGTNLYHSQSNPDLMTLSYDDMRCNDFPEHVLKVSNSTYTGYT